MASGCRQIPITACRNAAPAVSRIRRFGLGFRVLPNLSKPVPTPPVKNRKREGPTLQAPQELNKM